MVRTKGYRQRLWLRGTGDRWVLFSGRATVLTVPVGREQAAELRHRARARGGVVVNDSLWYVTGGAAWATVNENLALSSNFNPAAGGGILASPFVAGTNLAAFSHTKSGWTIGGGVETRLWGGWSAKLEYLYVDLGSVTDAFVIAGNPGFNTTAGAGATTAGAGNTFTVTSSTHIRDHIVRVGMNYKFW